MTNSGPEPILSSDARGFASRLTGQVLFRIRWTMPDSQAEEFNKLIGQLRGVTRALGPYALVLEQEVAHARTQLLLVSVLAMWGFDHSELVTYIAFQTNEPCTQDEFDQHLAGI